MLLASFGNFLILDSLCAQIKVAQAMTELAVTALNEKVDNSKSRLRNISTFQSVASLDKQLPSTGMVEEDRGATGMSTVGTLRSCICLSESV